MRRRRHQLYYAEALKRLAPAWLPVLFVALTLPSVLAGNSSTVAGDGVVHTVLSEAWRQGNNTGGTVLVHVAQNPDGTETRQPVNGTDNFTIERDAFIAIDPVSNLPVLVWAQVTSRATALYVARLESGSWTTPHLFWDDGSTNLDPNIDIRDNLLHIVWKQEGESPVRLRLSLARESFVPAFGPEYLPTDLAGIAPPGIDSGPIDSPGLDLSYFASVISPQVPDQPGRIITWGIRDEPVPVVYFQPFHLPIGIQTVREQNSEWLAGTFVTWFTSGSSFYYTTFDDGKWEELKVIDLDDGRSTAEALLLLQDMLRR